MVFESEHRRILEFCQALSKSVLTQLMRSSSPTNQTCAILYSRIANTIDSIHLLLDTSESDSQLDARILDSAALLRCAYDAHIQLGWICHAPALTPKRCQLYLDFEHVERYLCATATANGTSLLAKRIASSPMRPQAELANFKKYEAVRAQYTAKHATKPRSFWYPGTLRDLAKDIGLEEEYVIIVKLLHGATHTSAFALRHGGGASGVEGAFFSMSLAFRSIRAIRQVLTLDLTKEQLEIVLSKDNDPTNHSGLRD